MDWIKRMWRAAKAAFEAHGFVTSELFRVTLWPLAVAALSALAAAFDGIPLSYAIAAVSLTFAACMTLLVRFDEYRERTSPSGRLAATRLFFAPEVALDGSDVFLKNIQLGLWLKNSAGFALHYGIESFEAQVMGRVTTESPATERPVEIRPGDTALYKDHPIHVQAPTLKDFETGRVRFKIAYWKSPRRKYYIERSLRLYLRRNPETGQLDLNSTIE